MNNALTILEAWQIEPSILIGCLGLLVAGAAAVRWRLSRISVPYVAAILILAVALMSPIDVLGEYLFSAHMVQHLILLLIVAPLLIIGLPVREMRQLLRVPWVGGLERFLRHPLVAWVIGIGTVAVWHLPGMYNAALESEGVHIVEHLTFLIGATIFWWPLISPLPESRADLTVALFYLLMAAFANGLIGAVLMIVPAGIYPGYVQPTDPLHIWSFLQSIWPATAAEDKRLGAGAMIIGGGIAFMWGAAFMLWLHHGDQPATA